MKITVKELRSFLSDPIVPDEAIVEIGFERYDGNDDRTDIGYDWCESAELLILTRETIPGTRRKPKTTFEKLAIWATNYPEIHGEVLKTTRLSLE